MKLKRSKSKSHSSGDDETIDLALQRLLDKLKASQPYYIDDDVAEIPFMSDSNSSSSGSESPDARGEDVRPSEGQDGVGGRKTLPTEPAESLEKNAPLSAALFLTAVNLFEPKTVLKSRRACSEALRLIQQGYALVWNDPRYIDRPTRSVSPTPIISRSMLSSPSSPLSSSTNPRYVSSSSPTPVYSPDPSLVSKLDECMQTLLIYANNSSFLAQLIVQESYLYLLCFIGSQARELESDTLPTRTVEKELKRLSDVWAHCGLVGRVCDTLRECYLLDFLLDYALPPAVCSARYEGLSNTLLDRKHKIIADMVISRQGFSTMMEKVPLQGLSGLVSMSTHSEVKLRMRFLDKMASEGVMERLASEMESAIADLRRNNSSSNGDHADSGSRPNPRGSKAGGSRSVSVSPSKSRTPRKRGRPSASPKKSVKRTASQSPARESGIVEIKDPVDRIGLCIDILLQLTRPNLRSRYEAEELAANPKSSANAVVRSTVWAGREEALRTICSQLLWLVCHARGVVGSLVLLLQEQAADCLLHLAAYSGQLYGLVVKSIDSLLEGNLVLKDGGRPATGGTRGKRKRSGEDADASEADEGDDTVALEDPTGLLPLILQMLWYPIHAQANASSITSWFKYLSQCLIPQAFEAPTLTSGRRSSALWGKRQSSSGSSGNHKKNETPAAPVLARDVTRQEVRQLSPYFTFAINLVKHTDWREGAESFLARIALLAYHVVVHHRNRVNLSYGQASSCYDVVAPLLEPATGQVPYENSISVECTPARRTKGGQGGKEQNDETSVSPENMFFIPSPVKSPVFYETYSPSSKDSKEVSPAKARKNGSAATKGESERDVSPEAVTRTWRDRLSLRLWLLSFKSDDDKDS